MPMSYLCGLPGVVSSAGGTIPEASSVIPYALVDNIMKHFLKTLFPLQLIITLDKTKASQCLQCTVLYWPGHLCS